MMLYLVAGFNLAPVLKPENEKAFISVAGKMLALMNSRKEHADEFYMRNCTLGCYKMLMSPSGCPKGAPERTFIDIADIGVKIPLVAIEDATALNDFVGNVSVFHTTFPFFAQKYTPPYLMYVSARGYVSFTQQYTDLYSSIPNIFVPPFDVIAPLFNLWMPTYPEHFLKSAIYFYEDPQGDHIVFQWTNMQEAVLYPSVIAPLQSAATVTFQAVLKKSGEIYFLYKDVNCFTYTQVEFGLKTSYNATLPNGLFTPATAGSGTCNMFHYDFPNAGSVVYFTPKNSCNSFNITQLATCIYVPPP